MIKDVRRLYSNIPQDIFKEIIELDPTYKGNNSVGKYTKWMMARYLKHDFDKNHIKDLLQQFIEKKPYLANKDIGSYKSCKNLEDTLSQVKIEKTKRQELRELQNKIRNASIEEDKIYEDDEWEIYIPSTYENSCKLGQGTKWCTASNSNDFYFNDYTKRGKLYILINKKDNVKYQFHFESKQFMDKEDECIDIWNFFINYPHLKDVFNIENKGDFIVRNKEILSPNTKKPFITLDDNINFEVKKIDLGSTCVKLIITKHQQEIIDIEGSKLYEIYNLSKQKLSRDINRGKDIHQSLDEPSKLRVSNGVIYYINENEKIAVGLEDINATSIVIDEDCTRINHDTFLNCKYLVNLSIGNSVTSIGGSAFYYCSSLKYNVYDNAKYLGNNENPYLVLVKAINTDITTCTINSNTKVIYGSAFENCDSLTSIVIPNSVKSICRSAFGGCSKLTSITIPNSVTSIGDGAFEDCSRLTSIDIPNSITRIGCCAFCHCYSLTSITIPNGVKSIGYYTFSGCSSLRSVYYTGTIENWCNIIFSDYYSNPMCYASYFYIKNSNGGYEEFTEIGIQNKERKIIEWGI